MQPAPLEPTPAGKQRNTFLVPILSMFYLLKFSVAKHVKNQVEFEP